MKKTAAIPILASIVVFLIIVLIGKDRVIERQRDLIERQSLLLQRQADFIEEIVGAEQE